MPFPMATKRVRRVFPIVVVGIVVAIGAWYYARPDVLPIAVWTVQRGVVEATVANTRAGTVKACRRSRLAPSTGGQISHLSVHKGERVVAGQVLLELWNEDLVAQERLAQKQLAEALARSRDACLVAEESERAAERARRLKARGFVSEERMDQAYSDAKVRRADCVAAEAGVGQGRARIDAALATLERTRLRAPFAGIVADITGELGEFTTPSPPGIPTPPAIDLIDDSCMYVSAPIDEVDAPHVKLGMKGRISLDAMAGRHFSGKVRRVAAYVLDLEKQARTVEVEVQFDDPGSMKGMLVGYSADVEIVHASRRDVPRIPTSAMLEGGRVLVLGDDGLLRERPITTGLSNWEYTEVGAGLREGERIVTSLDRAGVKAGVRAVVEPAGATASRGGKN